MDQTLLGQVVNNPDLLRQAMEEFQRNLASVGGNPEPPAPTIDVPVRVVDPPVTLHGKLDLQVTFEAEVLAELPYDAIVQRVLDVISGGGDAWSPKVVVGNLRLERREYRDAGNTGRAGPGVSGAGVGQAGYPPDRESWERPGGSWPAPGTIQPPPGDSGAVHRHDDRDDLQDAGPAPVRAAEQLPTGDNNPG